MFSFVSVCQFVCLFTGGGGMVPCVRSPFPTTWTLVTPSPDLVKLVHLGIPPPDLVDFPPPLNWTCWEAGGWSSTERPSCSCFTHFLGWSSTLFPSRVLRSLGCPSQLPHIPSSSSPNVPGTRIVAIDVSPVPSNPTCKRGDKKS